MRSAEEAPPPGRREHAKSKRRARIVAAAFDLLREAGVEGLSVKTVAARAGLSLSTLYNLFGSKQAILAGVYDLDLARFEEKVRAAPSTDPLGRIFDAVDIAAQLYQADPGFYRAAFWRHPAGADAQALRATVREPRVRFWRDLAEAAVEAGQLRREAHPDVVAVLLFQISAGVLADWITGEISLEQLRREMKLGFSVALSTFAAPDAARGLRRMTAELHAQLAASGRRE